MVLGVGNSQILVIILCLGELLTVGLLLFSHGFLLTRQVVDKTSSCQTSSLEEPWMSSDKESKNASGCWTPPLFKKTVIVLIDALRYDFAVVSESLEDPKPYQNKMEVFANAIATQPKQARLYRFIADAPTTTMQRLKGLTTGSLPTFIDASNNFASEEITEDNIVDQLVRSGKRITMMGDDTWNGLFPGRFNRSFLYPSFNVMDLHTVDNGIISHLDEELARSDWDVVIAHFLGVDHCGHRYGPNHPEMEAKLLQMNDIIKSIMKTIENDTLLMVFGDHGMTKTGDHGGDSDDETTAALFVYSPSLNMPLHPQDKSLPSPVAQVDIIPTLAFAMGVPVPYSNLGKVIEDVLFSVSHHTAEETAQYQVRCLDLNVRQVSKYLEEYKSLGNEFPSSMWQELEALNGEIQKGIHELPFSKQKQMYVKYLVLAKMMCEEIWAKFNVAGMVSGLLLIGTVIFMACLILSNSSCVDGEWVFGNYISYMTLFINALFLLSFYISAAVLGFVVCFALLAFLYWAKNSFPVVFAKIHIYEIIPLLIVLVLCTGAFSNSYVIVENYIVAYLLVSVVTVEVFSSFMQQHKKKGVGSNLTGKLMKWASNFWGLMCVSSLLVVLVCVRVSSWFWKCREEQPWCIPGLIHTSLSGLPQDMRNWRYFTSLLSLILLTWLPRQWFVMCGNFNGTKLGVVLVRKVPVICSVLVASHWALQAVPLLQGSPLRVYMVIPPLVTYFLAIFLVVVLFFVPLMVYEVPPAKSDIGPVSENPYQCIPQLYHSLKAKYGCEAPKKSIPIVYGLATAVSAPLIGAIAVVLVIVVLLAGDGIAPGILILVASAVACLSAQAAATWMTADTLENVMKPSWSSICVWFLLSLHSFYTTGHHPTFPSLHWTAAFVGFQGGWGSTNIIPALLVGFNTFSAQIIFGFSLPLLVLCPLSLGVVFPKLRNGRLENEDTRQGEFLFVEDKKSTAESLLFTSTLYLALHAVKVFFSAASAFILRRHLMVWKIFAPHFIFEAVGFIVTCCCVPAGIFFTLRVIDVLDMFSVYLRHKYS